MTAVGLGPWAARLLASVQAAFLLWVTWGLGRSLLRAARVRGAAAVEEATLAFGAGAGTLSLVLLAMGGLGLYRPVPLAALLALLAGNAVLASRGGHVAGIAGGGRRSLGGRLPLAAAAVAAIALSWIPALSPPLFYDALVYHLGVPNLYLLAGGIVPLPGVVYAGFPLGMEMHYLLALSLGGPVTASLVNLGFGVGAAAAAAALARRVLGPGQGLPAAAFLLLTPTLFLLARYGTVESALALHVLLALLCLAAWREEGDLRWAALAGVFGGFSFGVKYLGGIQGVAIPLLLLVLLPGGRGGRGAAALRFSIAASVAAVPWLAKGALLTGNPVYPVLNGLFGAPGWSPEQAALLAADSHAAWADGWSAASLLRPLADLLLGTGDLGAARPAPGYWLLVLGAAVVALRRGDGRECLLAAGTLAYLAAWLLTFRLARFLLPAMGLASVLLASAAARLRVRPALVAAVLAALAAAPLAADRPTREAFGSVLDGERPEAYLRARLRAYPAMELAARELPTGSRVLVVGETRVAYLGVPHLFSTALDRPLLPELGAGSSTPGELADALRRRGITHLLVNVVEMRRLERDYPATALAPAWRDLLFATLQGHARELFALDGVFLYELAPPIR